jgi:hypothetical protein
MSQRKLRALVACEMSARVRTQFALRGWDATSADLLPDEAEIWAEPGQPVAGKHYQGDVLDIIEQDWDLVIAHPPCEDISQAGARYWAQKQADGRQQAAADFFMKMIDLPPKTAYVAVENPRGIMTRLYRPPDQVVEPWWFGDPLRKKTCWWLRGKDIPWYKNDSPLDERDLPSLPLLRADRMVDPTGRVATGGGSWRTDTTSGNNDSGGRRAGGVVPKGSNAYEDSQGRARRKILRSVTTPGAARAMAEQWGSYIESRRG